MSDLISRETVRETLQMYVPGFKWDTIDKIVDMMPSAQPERKTGRWIPCSERLPDVGQSIMISVAGIYTAEGCLREDGDWCQFRWDATHKHDVVDAWMPLPEPYTEAEP